MEEARSLGSGNRKVNKTKSLPLGDHGDGNTVPVPSEARRMEAPA